MRTILLPFTVLLISFTAIGQTSNSEVSGDTLTEHYYYKNGSLEMIRRYIKGRDMYSYQNFEWYYKNGNPRIIEYYNMDDDSSFHMSGRRNGSIEFLIKRVNGNFETVKENWRGELVERTYSHADSDSIFTEKYKRGELVETIRELSEPRDSGLDTVRHYQGDVGGNSAVILMETSTGFEYNVNGKRITKEEYQAYEAEYTKYEQSREPKHFYQEFTEDSVLVYEGVFRGGDLPCGGYNEYYNDGTIKTRGWYNEAGERTGAWQYYTREGQFIHSEFYKNGKLAE